MTYGTWYSLWAGGEHGEGMAFGTADPHRVGDVDRVPSGKRAPTGLARHVVAPQAELALRLLPEANVPPCTAARAPPDAPLPEPPLVTTREQVIRPGTLRLVARWRRQLRRMYRAAAAGELSRARRLRPEDLWIDHADSTYPEMAP